ncbi:MAG: oligosaccharide flippase family protein [Actinomycetota bacterium]|nr:oligosaccharide flippase family protein [Actinomycetota bacterium]
MAGTFVGLLSAEAVVRVFALIASVITVRALAPAGFGAFAYALAFAGIVGVTVDFGLSLLLIRDVSARPEQSAPLLGSTLVAIALVGGLAFAVAAALAFTGTVTGPASSAALLIAFGAAASDAVSLAFEATLTGHGRAGLLPLVRAARGTALVCAVAVATLWHPTPEGFLGASLAGSLLGAGTAAAACALRAVRPKFAGAVRRVLPLLRRALPFALLAASYLLYSRIDLVMLGLIDGRHAAGQYGVATRVLETALLVPIYFGSAFLATISHGVGGRLATPPTPQRTARALRASLLIGAPCSFGLALAGPWLVDLVAGPGYGSAGELLARLSPVIALVACYGVLSNLQLALDRTATLVAIVAGGALVKIAGNALLIPAYGARGAAATAVGVETLVVLAQWTAARRQLAGTGMPSWAARLAAAVGAMVAAGIALLSGVGAPWPVALAAGLAAFGLVGAAGGSISGAELRAAGSAITQAKRHGDSGPAET